MFIEKLNKMLGNLLIFSVTNSAVITIWTNDLAEAQRMCEQVYLPDGWEVKEPIETKWNWKRFEWQYRFKLVKK